MTIDTLQLKKDFISAGFADKKAEMLVKALQSAEDRAATREDIEHAVKTLDTKIEALENRLLLKMPAIIFVGLGLLKYFGLYVS